MTIRVVVADDQELVRSGFAMILDAQPDIEVVAEAGDGRAAVEAVRRLAPDVALLDIRMPGTDGIEACRAIGAGTGCRTVMLTTFDSDEYVYEALHAGASGFLLKDVRRDDLVHAVRVVAAGDSLLAPSVARKLIAEYTSRPCGRGRGTVGAPGRTDRPGARDAAAPGPRAVERGDRGGAGRQRAHGEDPCRQCAVQAGAARPDPGGDLRVRVRCRDSLSGRGPFSGRGSPSGGRSGVRLPRAGEPISLRQTPGRGIRPGGPVNRMEFVSS